MVGAESLTVTADTNILVRLMVEDDAEQAAAGRRILLSASRVVITLTTLCEYVWVLRGTYGLSNFEIARGIEELQQTATVQVDRAAVAAGLRMLRAGGDFPDGLISQEGRLLGGETFISFDRKAVKLLQAQGFKAQFP